MPLRLATDQGTSTFLVARVSSSNPSLGDEIACYSLPYGALGFISHILTYYTIVCLSLGRRPLWPFSKVSASKFDAILGFVGLCITSTFAIMTLIKCRHSWQLVTIGVWKLGMSWLNTLSGLTSGLVAIEENRRRGKEEEERKRIEGVQLQDTNDVSESAQPTPGSIEASPKLEEKLEPRPHMASAYWVAPYTFFVYVGLSGLISLVVKHWYMTPLMQLTIVYLVCTGVAPFGVALWLFNSEEETDSDPPPSGALHDENVHPASAARSPSKDEDNTANIVASIMSTFLFAFLLAPLYCDWALGIMTGNLTGVPSKDNSAFYWTYFFAKRLTTLSL